MLKAELLICYRSVKKIVHIAGANIFFMTFLL
jgi:hypothetical protein